MVGARDTTALGIVKGATALGHEHAPNSRDTLNVVRAALPDDRSKVVSVEAAPETLRAMVKDRWNSKIGEYLGLVHGNVRIRARLDLEPFDAPTQGLLAAQACFTGLRRPMGTSPNGDKVAVYVIQSIWTYRSPDPYDAAVREVAPLNAVFTVAVDFTDASAGQVISWEWVLAAKDDTSLPENYQTRYARRHW
jgi:hypothetical protein